VTHARTVVVSLLFAIGSTGCSAGAGEASSDEEPPVATDRADVRNGVPDSSGQYSNVVLVVMHPDLLTTLYCTGMIISTTRVLTAAHCLANTVGLLQVVYNGRVQNGQNVRVHPLFKSPVTLWAVSHPSIAGGTTGVTDGPDLATFDVAQPLPVALGSLGGSIQPGQSLTIAGYGLTATNVPAPGVRVGTELATTLLPMIRGGTPRLNAGTVVVSAGTNSTIGCSGDSGAPVMTAAGNVVAITSTGVGDCSSSPNNSATLVSPYLGWIFQGNWSHPYHNYKLAVDVNDDGFVTSADAQMITNTINAGGGLGSAPPGYRDVWDDLELTTLDALLVTSALNQPQATGFTISPP
jgi:hypothetical protein